MKSLSIHIEYIDAIFEYIQVGHCDGCLVTPGFRVIWFLTFSEIDKIEEIERVYNRRKSKFPNRVLPKTPLSNLIKTELSPDVVIETKPISFFVKKMNQNFVHKDGKKLVPMKVNLDGTTSVYEDFPGFPTTAEPTTKKGTELNRHVHEENGRKVYEWDQNLEGEDHVTKGIAYPRSKNSHIW